MEEKILIERIKYARLLGEFIGTLKGITYNDIPEDLKLKLEAKIKELENGTRTEC